MWMVGSPGNQLPSFVAFRSHLLNINSNQKRFVMNIKATLSLLGNFKGFRSSVWKPGMKTHYIFCIINHSIIWSDTTAEEQKREEMTLPSFPIWRGLTSAGLAWVWEQGEGKTVWDVYSKVDWSFAYYVALDPANYYIKNLLVKK